MANYTIRKLTDDSEKHMTGEELYELLRKEDKREIMAMTSDVRQEVLDSIFQSDECWAAFTKQERSVIAVWGICKLPKISGRLIWCLGTYRVRDFWLPFATVSRNILHKWVNRYGRLYNNVGAFNTDSIRWLEWCGATFGKKFPMRHNGNVEYFIPFELERGSNNVQRNRRTHGTNRIYTVSQPAAAGKRSGGNVPTAGTGSSEKCPN